MLEVKGKKNFKTIEGMSEIFNENGSNLRDVYSEFILKLNGIGINPAYHGFIFDQVSDISKILCSPKYTCQSSPDTLDTKLNHFFDGLVSTSHHTVLP